MHLLCIIWDNVGMGGYSVYPAVYELAVHLKAGE